MDNSIVFKNNAGTYCVCFSEKIKQKLFELCSRATPKETGGILIGTYSKDQSTAIITTIVSAPKNSVSKQFSFLRGTKGLLKILDRSWDQGKYYLGEWHYHPNAQPIPSIQDKEQMVKLSQSKGLKCPEPILIIVGGNYVKWRIKVMVFVNKQMVELKDDNNDTKS